ncbi:hypothetical protein FKN04_12600 [Bacillus glycinifermentans]|uniref:hypothetical protein n=1 Tax=Bacillus glycinifermentans TaxID=1664069 RepID=UPI0015823FC0|nr:hypothetical protein [Bacillus glycinifermentans]NUJ17415.1 hypothetical protein [Bacillus glycinifermentans]
MAGIIENPMATPSKLLKEIYEIVGDHLERYPEKSDLYVITDHWVVYNPIEKYWGVYYKEGHECVIDTCELNCETFTNQYV